MREEPGKAARRRTPQRSEVAPNDKRRTLAHPKVPPVPPQRRRARVLVDLRAVKVRKREAPTLSAHVTTGQVLENSADTAARNRGGLAAAHQDEEKGAAAAVGATVAKPPAAGHTPVAQSAPRRAAVPTATAAEATRTATVIIAQRAAGDGVPNAPLIQSTRGEEAEDGDSPGDISTPPPLRTTRARVLAATVAGRGTDGTTEAAPGARAAGAAAPVRDLGGGATVEATAPRAAPPVQPKARLTGERPGVEQTATPVVETSTARGFTAPSPLGPQSHEALTEAATPRALRP